MEKQNEMPLWMQRAIGIGIASLGFILIAVSTLSGSQTSTYFGLLLAIVGLPLTKTFSLISIKSDYL